MTDLVNVFKKLRRPKLLISAARIGSAEYRRERDLKRLIKAHRLPTPNACLSQLLTLESELESVRKDGSSTYSISRHVEVLAALIAELRLLPRPRAV